MPLHQVVCSVFFSVSLMPFEAILIFNMLIQLEIESYKEKKKKEGQPGG